MMVTKVVIPLMRIMLKSVYVFFYSVLEVVGKHYHYLLKLRVFF